MSWSRNGDTTKLSVSPSQGNFLDQQSCGTLDLSSTSLLNGEGEDRLEAAQIYSMLFGGRRSLSAVVFITLSLAPKNILV